MLLTSWKWLGNLQLGNLKLIFGFREFVHSYLLEVSGTFFHKISQGRAGLEILENAE